MNINKIKELCELYGFSPSKQYGQNYLINDGIVNNIVKVAEIKSTDTIIEVGPGFGVLTFALAEKAKKIVAFEIEKKLEKYWQENKPENVEIVWGNALSELKNYKKIEDYKVVANIPYQVTSELLRTILELENKPEMIVVMVQKEVAQRICARKGEMSLLALSVQYYGEPELVSVVTSGNFWPAPKVDSAILRIRLLPPHPSPLLGQERGDKIFFKFARAGFAFKRKQLWSNLAKGLGLDGKKVKKILKEVVGNDKVRAEELGVEDWKKIVDNF